LEKKLKLFSKIKREYSVCLGIHLAEYFCPGWGGVGRGAYKHMIENVSITLEK
jgi:hypothetical protein